MLKFLFIIFIVHCSSFFIWGQPANDNCVNAINLCPNVQVSGTNQDASVDACSGCSDGASTAGNFCYSLENTIWYMFTTDSDGGDVSVDLTGINCVSGVGLDNELQGVIIEAGVPCDESTYNLMSNCPTASGTMNLSATGLNPNTTYYIQIDGDFTGAGITDPAMCNFSILLSGTGVEEANQATLNTSQTTVCENDIVQFNVETPDCENQSYSWYVDGVLVATGNDSVYNHVALLDVSVSVEVNCADNISCPTSYTSNSISLSVEEVDVDAGQDVTIIQGESTTLSGTGTGILSWSPPLDLSNTNTSNPVASPDQTTTYFLTTTTATGCEETDEVTIIVLEPIAIANVVTPNGDGINDSWIILRIELYPLAKVSIYDRWGQRLLNDVGYQNDWDGVFLGKALPPSTYYYVIELNVGSSADNNIKTGFIELIY